MLSKLVIHSVLLLLNWVAADKEQQAAQLVDPSLIKGKPHHDEDKPDRKSSHEPSRDHHHHHHPMPVVEIKPNKGFYPFQFGQYQTPVNMVFHYCTEKVTYVTVSDCYCSGDQFQFFDNGRYLTTTEYGCESQDPTTKSQHDLKCKYNTKNPKQCLFGGNHCFGIAAVLPGNHTISIETITSSMTGGTAFIRVDDACQVEGSYYPCCLLKKRGCNFDVYHERHRSHSHGHRSHSHDDHHRSHSHSHGSHRSGSHESHHHSDSQDHGSQHSGDRESHHSDGGRKPHRSQQED